MKVKCLTIVLCSCLLAGLLYLTGCTSYAPQQGTEESTNPQQSAITLSKADLIHSLIYSVLPENSSSDTTKLLNTLKVFDPIEAAVWKQLLLYWDEVNQPGFVSLPYISPNAATTPPEDVTLSPDPDTYESPEPFNTSSEPDNVILSNLNPAIPDQPLPDDLPKDDTLVLEVLGLALLRDGSMREELTHRLETALACAEQYPEAYVLVTGGGTASENPEATEADAMAAWLIEKGLDKDRLIIENRSKTTCENAVFSYDILHKNYPQISSMVIISSDYHIPLGCMLFQAWFLLNSENTSPAISVIGNACCLSGAYTFTLQEQAYWLENLTTYLP